MLDWAVGKGLHLIMICFGKGKSRLITFRSGETETMTDYIGEGIVSQHCLLMKDMVFKKKVRTKVKFRKKLKPWRLRESEMKE